MTRPAILALLAACSGDDVADPEPTGTPPTSSDETAGDTAVPVVEGEVTVELWWEGRTRGDNPVVFHHPDGSIRSEIVTSADGIATGTVEAGGMVSIPLPAEGVVYTAFDVRPGDELIVGERKPPSASTITTAQVRSLDTVPGASWYTFSTGCSQRSTADPTGAEALDVDERCLNDANQFHVLAQAIDANDRVIATAAVTDIDPLVGNTGVVLPPWLAAPAELEVVVDGAPVVTSGISVTPLRDGVAFDGGGIVLSPRSSIRSALAYAPSGFADSAEVELIFQEPKGFDVRFAVFERRTPAPAQLTFTAADFDVAIDGAWSPGRAGGPALAASVQDPHGAVDGVGMLLAWEDGLWLVSGAADRRVYPLPEDPWGALPDETATLHEERRSYAIAMVSELDPDAWRQQVAGDTLFLGLLPYRPAEPRDHRSIYVIDHEL